MDVRAAKAFLVEQAAQQANVENVPLSDLEKRMMCFTESDDTFEDPIKLNEEFEAAYETDEYEAKISGLLRRAYKRIANENQEMARQWDGAIRVLRKGDHYLLVLWDQGPSERPPHDSLKLLGSAIVVSCAFVPLAILSDRLARYYPHFPIPGWLLRRLAFLFVVALYFGVRHIAMRRRIGGQSNTGSYFDLGSVPTTTQELFAPRFWKLLAIAILALIVLMIGFVAYLHHGDSKPPHPNAVYLTPTNFSNSPSLRIVTPSSLAFSYFDPGSVPTTT